MSKPSEKLVAIFEQSKLKTIGDLIDSELSTLPGADKFPARIRDYTLDPRNTFMLPENFIYDSSENGVPADTIEAVGNRAIQIRADRALQVIRDRTAKP